VIATTEFPTTLDDYFARYSNDLAEQAARSCKPLHVPGEQEPYQLDLLRPPFEAQSHVITAAVKSLRHQKAITVCAEMGTGKTLLSQAICQGHAQGGYRALVFCPPHLPMKWEREIRETVPNAIVYHIESYKDLQQMDRRAPACGRTWWIITNTKAKLGTGWKPAYHQGRYPIGRGNFATHHQLRGNLYCPQCGELLDRWDAKEEKRVALEVEDLEKRRHFCQAVIDRETNRVCGAPLWQWDRSFDRWPIASYIHKKLSGFFDYLVIDESHQAKAADSAIGAAMGSLTAACKKTIMLTGTVLGGYAWHIRPMLFRTSPSSLVEEGFTWENETKFNEVYGRMERKVTITKPERSRNSKDNKVSKGTTTKTTKYVRPGVMPSLFGKHLIQNMVFLSLDEVAENLPKLDEQIIECQMDAEQLPIYQDLEKKLTAAIKQMAKQKNNSLMARMMHALLGWADHPYGWGEIGYNEMVDGYPVWNHVVTPKPLSRDTIRPKEKAIIDFCLAERAAGRQTWIYSTMTGEKDCNARLNNLMRDHGLRCDVLRSTVETKVREQWIYDRASDLDVCISHPQLVETGLDLFDKKGNHNFSSIAFYQTGYNLFTLRQASRRGWRIGQPLDCKVAYFYYGGTMQARAMTLMGKKMSAAQSIEGKFSSEGLAAMAGDEGSMEAAMARSLVERLDDLDVGRTWVKVGAAPRPPIESPVATPVLAPAASAPIVAPIVPTAGFKRPGRAKVVQQKLF